jgi:O-antigen ligase
MTVTSVHAWFVAVAAATAAAVAVLAGVSGLVGLVGTGFLVTWLVFVLWPWAVLPTAIIGGTVASALIGDTGVHMLVTMHAIPVVAGLLALITRTSLGYDRDLVPRFYRRAGLLAPIVLAALAVYGLAVGNATTPVFVATYHIAVLPAYFLMAMHTLGSPQWRTRAAILFTAPVVGVALFSFGLPGRHGGLLSLLAMAPLMVLAGQSRRWHRTAYALMAAALAADVVLSSFRGIWLAAGVVVAILLLRGGTTIRRGVLITALTVVTVYLFVVALGLSPFLQGRSATVAEQVDRDAGYRLPEAEVGLRVFESRPWLGAGPGQSTPDVYLPGFAVTDVGPVYHAFYVLILANIGLLGLCAIAWPMLRAVRLGLAERDGMALAFAALTCGFLVNALVTGPNEGHWELGILPALILLLRQRAPRPFVPRRPAPDWTLPAARTRETGRHRRPVALTAGVRT